MARLLTKLTNHIKKYSPDAIEDKKNFTIAFTFLDKNIFIKITEEFPFERPIITIDGEDYYRLAPINDESLITIANILERINNKITIKNASIPEPLYLVVGSYPTEDRKGRDFYDNPRYYMLDNHKGVYHSRYFNVNFNEPDELKNLSLSKKFERICFDWSVTKYFKFNEDSKMIKCLEVFKNLLTDDGILYFDTPDGPPGGGRIFGNTTNYEDIFLENCKAAGLVPEIIRDGFDDLCATSDIFNEVYCKRDWSMNTKPNSFLLAKKKVYGGRRRILKSRRQKRQSKRSIKSRRN
jgi:hypothetical protein